jgi:SAM-dependent methyltransferase
LFFAYGEYFRSHPTPGRILHLAPERCFRRLFHSRSAQYITSNYDREPSDLRLDVTRLGVRSGAIDLVVANGVMSYAGDHREAVDNLFRVLAPGGVALLCDIVNPEGRSGERPPEGHGQLRHFGGRDLAQKFTPFTANLIDVRTFVPRADHERFGIRRDDFYLIRLDKPLNGGTPA